MKRVNVKQTARSNNAPRKLKHTLTAPLLKRACRIKQTADASYALDSVVSITASSTEVSSSPISTSIRCCAAARLPFT